MSHKINQSFQRVLIMAGGTGGHVFPGLALAHYLRTKEIEIHWLGTQQGVESQLVPEAGITLHCISIGGLRGKGMMTLLQAPFKLLIALFQSCRILYQVKPDVVIGFGGFASGPGGLATWLMRYPLVIHEQNAKVGFTNKVLAFFSKKILEGFPAAFKSRSKVVVIGNPVRQEIENLYPPIERMSARQSPCHLLVLGGSLGAQAINEILPKALLHLSFTERPEILHQTGKKHFDVTKQAYQTRDLPVNLVPFIGDMAAAYQWADIVLCRAGALTVAELCTVGLGAIFVPYPHAVDDHQTANAQYMVNHQAAVCIQQSDLSEKGLAEIISNLASSPAKRLRMAQAAYQLRFVDVSEKIFAILCALANEH
ncbi:MAG: undecaprenyldiphospho-muramoylpentapeptide beta-N-acetylglucosaminyltransferase [Gammaproteobacteria bacterium RIFCSPHIGHO2_12_FULL_37_14]|nr:MAG: undecaprenyldiphospho-muramoylpentapeptide beta-N-acetylglucosaminyltransferase [Gammaproteobacteria bacterium RIFCSPHIGHO2_12_FULL_37_14]